MKLKSYIILAAASAMTAGCTNLDETIYSSVGSGNYYNTPENVLTMVYRPFEHAFWAVQYRYQACELSADQIVSINRDGMYDDSGSRRVLHYHTYGVVNPYNTWINGTWNGHFQGVGECNFVIEELEKLNPEKFGFSQAEFDALKCQCRVLRAWFYITLLDYYRNLPYVVSYYDQSLNTQTQVEPRRIFELIEEDCLTGIKDLPAKQTLGSQASIEGTWTKAGAAALLVRLYLNAGIWIGEDRYADCEKYARAIINGDYGPYEVADRWDAIFDWDNDTCDEMIFGFPAANGHSYHHYSQYMFWHTVPYNSNPYFGDTRCNAGYHASVFAAAPSYDTGGKLYDTELGMPVERFRKYPGDYRLIKYRNLGNNRREGMFLYGYIDCPAGNGGATTRLKSPYTPTYDIYLRDAVGQFHSMEPDQWDSSLQSNHLTGDHNSGWHYVKYPLYSDNESGQLASDYAEIRLPEIIYSLAECLIRRGATEDAAKLLNSVRRRNYPSENYDQVLYEPEGRAKLDIDEMLHEWGREFFAEGRRRTDLIRFGKFNSGRWWDKTPDPDNHTAILPLTNDILNLNHNLKQNPGY